MKQASVEQIRVHLRTSGREAEPLQRRCSTWFHEHGRAPLAALLTTCAQEHEAGLSIDRLTLDVGEIALSRFETEMSERVMTALAEQLRSYQRVAGANGVSDTNGTWPEALYANANDMRPNAGWDATMHTSSGARARDAFAQLLRYLDTGYVSDSRPWSTREARERWLVAALEASACVPASDTTAPPQVELALRVLEPRARQRLVSTRSGLSVSTLIGWLIAPTRLPIRAQREDARLLPLAALIALQQHPEAAAYYEAALSTVSRSRATSMASTEEPPGTDTAGLAEPLVRPGASLEFGRPQPVTRAASNEAEHEPDEASASSPGDHTLDTWLDTLLRTPLSAPLRTQLQEWLLEPSCTRQMIPRLANLSAPVRQRLRAVLGLPLPPPTLHVKRSEVPKTPPRLPTSPASQPSPSVAEPTEPWIVSNAGLVLLWPLLPKLFDTFGWLDNGRFVEDAVRWQAHGCLDWLAWGDLELAEWRTPFTRLLCGIPRDAPFEPQSPTPERQAELDAWLTQTFAALPTLNRCSVTDLRAFFLQRPGTLVDDEHVTLTIEPDATDVLLHSLPWPLTQVMLPWLSARIGVNWIS